MVLSHRFLHLLLDELEQLAPRTAVPLLGRRCRPSSGTAVRGANCSS